MECKACGEYLDLRNLLKADGSIACPRCGARYHVELASPQAEAQPARHRRSEQYQNQERAEEYQAYEDANPQPQPARTTYSPYAASPAQPQTGAQAAPVYRQQQQTVQQHTDRYSAPQTNMYFDQRFQPQQSAPAKPPVSKGKRALGVISLFISIGFVAVSVFLFLLALQEGPTVTVGILSINIVALILACIGKGGCAIAGRVISIIMIVISLFAVILFFGTDFVVNTGFNSLSDTMRNLQPR